MQKIVELITSFPTVIFTVPMIFCFMWFLLGMVVSGLDVGEGDFDIDADADGDIDGLDHIASALHLGTLGLPLVLLMLTFVGWAVSLMFSIAMDSAGASTALTVLGGLVLGLVGGVLFVWKIGGALGRALTTETAPERGAAIGCTCRVRTLEVSESFGDAELLSGPMRTSLVKVRAKAGLFHRGDIALVVELDPATDAYWIAEIEEEYQPQR